MQQCGGAVSGSSEVACVSMRLHWNIKGRGKMIKRSRILYLVLLCLLAVLTVGLMACGQRMPRLLPPQAPALLPQPQPNPRAQQRQLLT